MNQVKDEFFDRVIASARPSFGAPPNNPKQAFGFKTGKLDMKVVVDAINALRKRGFGDDGDAGWYMNPTTYDEFVAEADPEYTPKLEDGIPSPIRGYPTHLSPDFPEDAVLIIDYDAVTTGGHVLHPAGVVVVGIEGGSDE